MRRAVVSVSSAAVIVAQSAQRLVRAAEEQPEEAKPLEGVKPFVALFLDEASKTKLAEKWPETAGARSASYILLEPTEVTSDKTRPAVFAPLMAELGQARLVAKKKQGEITTLRAEVSCAGGPIDGLKHLPNLSWGNASDDDVAHEGGRHTEDFDALDEPYLEVTGTICRAEYFYQSKCHLEPLMECPLCAYMKQSPCKDAFIKWEDCLNSCEAQGGTDEERQERFISTCVAQTVGLKECVDQYPEFFNSMFGGEEQATAKDDEDQAKQEAPSSVLPNHEAPTSTAEVTSSSTLSDRGNSSDSEK